MSGIAPAGNEPPGAAQQPRPVGKTIAALGTAQTLAWASSYYLPAVLADAQAKSLGLPTSALFLAFSAALLISGLLGPQIGKLIDQHGGRHLLMLSSTLFALGLTILGLSQGMISVGIAWVILGIAMGMGLYEAAFATLVVAYGQHARKAITGITLLAGFASTVGWPATTWLVHTFDWRTACFVWAVAHVLIGLPLNVLMPNTRHTVLKSESAVEAASGAVPISSATMRITILMAIAFGLAWFIATAMATHLPRLLQAAGATPVAALSAAALVGPMQVMGRIAEFGWLRHHHALISARFAAALHPIGVVVMLAMGGPAVFVFTAMHGMGNGIMTIAKGTLPLAIFGPDGYGARLGLLMAPARIGQAFAPLLFGFCLDRWGAGAAWLSGMAGTLAFLALLCIHLPASTGQPR
ncbi:putative sialic acid transporter [Andreprevotia sp. IGB-42]|uniref:MFS transporter n=1 Tax=Andreprevotia sp. IGB-42 TaxID=2497473 RepID=UPI0013579D49|nr:MFS transporter [Andreprevotia sp. IGB-42]KAF0813485.1 putative sialic acid transporter [Andreprevotia sp. IGB-42]